MTAPYLTSEAPLASKSVADFFHSVLLDFSLNQRFSKRSSFWPNDVRIASILDAECALGAHPFDPVDSLDAPIPLEVGCNRRSSAVIDSLIDKPLSDYRSSQMELAF